MVHLAALSAALHSVLPTAAVKCTTISILYHVIEMTKYARSLFDSFFKRYPF